MTVGSIYPPAKLVASGVRAVQLATDIYDVVQAMVNPTPREVAVAIVEVTLDAIDMKLPDNIERHLEKVLVRELSTAIDALGLAEAFQK